MGRPLPLHIGCECGPRVHGTVLTVFPISRPQSNAPTRLTFQPKIRISPIGGTLTISLVQTHASPRAGGGPERNPKERILAKVQQEAKLNGARPSDEAETFRLVVKWEPAKNALGVHLPPHLEQLEPHELEVVRL